jgi:peptidoglycan/LPS O-acetylase OafA/YrhL
VSIIRKATLTAGSAAIVVLGSAAVAQAQTSTDTTSSGINPVVYLIGGVIFGIVCAVVANNKGRSPVLWGILGFLFGFIPLIIIALLKKKEPGYPSGYGSSQGAPPPPPPV